MPIIGAVIKRAIELNSRLPFPRPSALDQQERTLRRLLKRAMNTAFGRHYRFRDILRADDLLQAYQSTVPIFDYNAIYEAWWHRTLNQEANVCWPGKIKYFALSSGTTGASSKHIPVTMDMTRSMRRAGLRMFISLGNHPEVTPMYFERSMMMLGGSTDLTDKGGFEVGDLSGINATKLPFWLRRFYKPGSKIAKLRDWNERLDEIAKEAPSWDIAFVMGIPSWVQLMMEKIIDYHKVQTIHDIWPNLGIYVTGGVAFEPYRKGFERLLARPIKYLDTYLASEGFLAFQDHNENGHHAMALQLDNGIFLEFVPFNDENFDQNGNIKPHPQVLNIAQVRQGVDYALLLTTCAGAWRYLIGDTVRFKDLEQHRIIITGRTKHFLSICGEHLSVDNMNQALQLVERDMNVSIREFTVAAVRYAESFGHKWYVGCEPLVDADVLCEKLDGYLKNLNDDYRTERNTVLQNMEVRVIPTHIFYDWHAAKNKMGGQTKFPRVMKGESFAEWQEFVASKL